MPGFFLDIGTRALESFCSYCFSAICNWLPILHSDKLQSNRVLCTIVTVFVSAYPSPTSFSRFIMNDKGKFRLTHIIQIPEKALEYLYAFHGCTPLVGPFLGKLIGSCYYWKADQGL